MGEERTIAHAGKLRILYTGDLHGNVEKMKYLATVIKQIQGDDRQALLVDSGDWSKGSPLADQFGGLPMAEIMRHLRYDALCLGEEDLMWGVRGLKKLSEKAGIPFLSANVRGKAAEFVKPFIIKEIAGMKVAIAGLSPSFRLPTRQIGVSEPEAALESALLEMAAMKPHFTILLSHLGIEKDRDLASRFPSLQLIIGGHSHIRTEEPERWGETLIVHGGAHGEFLGSLELTIAGNE